MLNIVFTYFENILNLMLNNNLRVYVHKFIMHIYYIHKCI